MTPDRIQALQAYVPVVLVMGQAGVGKSYFINTALRNKEALVDDDLECKTNPPQPFFCNSRDRPLYLVDTPGFDDTNRDDQKILEYILGWFNLHASGRMPNARFGGILYLVEAGQSRLPMHDDFKQIPILRDRLLVVGTKSGRKWRSEVEVIFAGSPESAWGAIDAVLGRSQDMADVVFQSCMRELETLVSRKSSKTSRKSWRKAVFAMFSKLFMS